MFWLELYRLYGAAALQSLYLIYHVCYYIFIIFPFCTYMSVSKCTQNATFRVILRVISRIKALTVPFYHPPHFMSFTHASQDDVR